MLKTNAVGIIVGLAMLAPVIKDKIVFKAADQNDVPMYLAVGLTVVVFSMTRLTTKTRNIMTARLVEKVNDEFLAQAHTLLGFINAGVRMLRGIEEGKFLTQTDQFESDTRRAIRGLEVARWMIESHLDVARNPTQVPLQLCKCSVSGSLEQVVEQLRNTFSLNGAKLICDLSGLDSGAQWAIDQHRLFVVWYNLATNSCNAWRHPPGTIGGGNARTDYTDLKMTIKARLSSRKRKRKSEENGNLDGRSTCLVPGVEVRFVDNGPGRRGQVRRDPDDLLFGDNGPGRRGQVRRDPDDLLEAWMSDTPGGHGLGLYICRLYIEQHDGEFSLEDAPQGAGLEAVMWIPRTQGADLESENHHASNQDQSADHR